MVPGPESNRHALRRAIPESLPLRQNWKLIADQKSATAFIWLSLLDASTAGCPMVLGLQPVSPRAEASDFLQKISQFPSMALCSPLESFPAEIPMTTDATMRPFNHEYFWKRTVRRSIFGPKE
jgi:hypothetical protein